MKVFFSFFSEGKSKKFFRIFLLEALFNKVSIKDFIKYSIKVSLCLINKGVASWKLHVSEAKLHVSEARI